MKVDKNRAERTLVPAANSDDEDHDYVIWGKSGEVFAKCCEQ